MPRRDDPANPGVAVDGGSSGEDETAAKLAAEQEQGFRGDPVDPTPNENYTVAGVTAGAPTPETDASLAAEAREATRVGGTKFEHGEGEAETSAEDGEAETKLTGDELEDRLEDLGIDASSGGSNADGSMSADEKREAIAAAEASGSGNGS